jgi:UDP-3-O-[3-hydroxymyristoyl] glucosamine N-acyltransferase
MFNNIFFNKKINSLKLSRILEITNSKLSKNVDINQEIIGISSIDNSNSQEITFLSSTLYFDQLANSKAGYCFIEEKYLSKINEQTIGVINSDPYFAYAKIAQEFYQEIQPEFSLKNINPDAIIGKNCNIAPSAIIGKNVKIGDNCFISHNVVILDNCSIGDNCQIHSNVSIAFSEIGSNCIIHCGVRIGQDGFGFANHLGINFKIIQLGIVKIGDDVEIGANTCIDRGALQNTIIHDQVKIDNLCQIAHNVEIGKGTVIAGCSAIAGSTSIGNYCQIGGGCCINGHIKIGNMVKIAGMSGVMRNAEDKQIIAGIPALPIKKWHRINSTILNLIDKKISLW